LIICGLLGGFASGLLGLGGGSVFVPLMVFWLGMKQHEAHGTSLFVIFPTAIIGSGVYALHGNVRFDYVLWLAIFALVAANFGVATAARISSKNLRKMYAVVLCVVAWKLIF